MVMMNIIKNKNDLYNTKINVYQRLVTFEQNIGPFDNQPLKGTTLPNKIL